MYDFEKDFSGILSEATKNSNYQQLNNNFEF